MFGFLSSNDIALKGSFSELYYMLNGNYKSTIQKHM